MPIRKFTDTIKYYCIKSLYDCGFAKKSYLQAEDKKKYCDCYPYLFSNNLTKDDELSNSLYYRHIAAKKLFSWSNINF